jgi:hypothetical protein
MVRQCAYNEIGCIEGGYRGEFGGGAASNHFTREGCQDNARRDSSQSCQPITACRKSSINEATRGPRICPALITHTCCCYRQNFNSLPKHVVVVDLYRATSLPVSCVPHPQQVTTSPPLPDFRALSAFFTQTPTYSVGSTLREVFAQLDTTYSRDHGRFPKYDRLIKAASQQHLASI